MLEQGKAYFVSGISTEIGKTVVSAILVEAFQADYWKPVQSGDLHFSDTMKVEKWISNTKTVFHPEQFCLKTPMSPHASAEIDNITIQLSDFHLPKTSNTLIIEGAGGLLVPLNDKDCIIDLIQHLQVEVIVVSQHYLGSINHTLLSIEALKARNIPIKGIVFNGDEHPSTEAIIQKMADVPILFRLNQLEEISAQQIQKFVKSI